MRRIVPAAGLALATLGTNAASAAFGVVDGVYVLVTLTGMGGGLGALVLLHADGRTARRTHALRRATLQRQAKEARCSLRLLQTCTKDEVARLRELRRQVHQGERTEFPAC